MTSVYTNSLVIGLTAALAIACGGKDDDTGSDEMDRILPAELQESDMARSPFEGTPEGVGLIEFLNAESTTYEVLDHEVPLDRRAAGNLIAHRDGGDRQWGTSDDDIYSDVDEVDRVRFVGPKTLDRLVYFASKDGWVPGADDILGVYDGVSFTVNQAEATLYVANTLDADALDFDLQLDARAVESIVEARPIDTVDHLSRLYYVGGSALQTLRDHNLDVKD